MEGKINNCWSAKTKDILSLLDIISGVFQRWLIQNHKSCERFLGVFTVFYVFYLIDRCTSPAALLDQSLSWRVGSCYLSNSMSSTPPCTGLYSEEDKEASPHRDEITRQAADYRLWVTMLNWRIVKFQGLLPTVEEIFTSHWTAIAYLKLGSPQPVRCCPTMVCLPLWVYED